MTYSPSRDDLAELPVPKEWDDVADAVLGPTIESLAEPRGLIAPAMILDAIATARAFEEAVCRARVAMDVDVGSMAVRIRDLAGSVRIVAE